MLVSRSSSSPALTEGTDLSIKGSRKTLEAKVRRRLLEKTLQSFCAIGRQEGCRAIMPLPHKLTIQPWEAFSFFIGQILSVKESFPAAGPYHWEQPRTLKRVGWTRDVPSRSPKPWLWLIRSRGWSATGQDLSTKANNLFNISKMLFPWHDEMPDDFEPGCLTKLGESAWRF